MASKEDRANAYASAGNGMASIEALDARLTKDLRASIQKLASYPVLSKNWCEMSKSVKRISRAAAMEEQLEKKQKDETLWEGEEQALRFILEDGKLNLCLRLLVDVKTFQYEALGDSNFKVDEADEDELIDFEAGMGSILYNCWKHSEAIQTTDIPLLIGHVIKVLTKADRYNSLVTSVSKKVRCSRQETLVIYYIRDLLKQMTNDQIAEHRIMPKVLELDLTGAVVRHLTTFNSDLGDEANLAGCEVLALVFSSDDFQGDNGNKAAKYVPQDMRSKVSALQDLFLKDLLSADSSRKRVLRPLTDQINRYALGGK